MNETKKIEVSVKFSCTAKLDPSKARICAVINERSSCDLLGIEARSAMSPYISCDDIELEKRLGNGTYLHFFFYLNVLLSFGTVYKGTYKGTPVAIKKYNDFLPSNDIEAQNFFNFRNEYVVGFRYICCSLNGLVLEYCRFGSVQSWFKKGKLTDELKVLICYDCARGMQVCLFSL